MCLYVGMCVHCVSVLCVCVSCVCVHPVYSTCACSLCPVSAACFSCVCSSCMCLSWMSIYLFCVHPVSYVYVSILCVLRLSHVFPLRVSILCVPVSVLVYSSCVCPVCPLSVLCFSCVCLCGRLMIAMLLMACPASLVFPHCGLLIRHNLLFEGEGSVPSFMLSFPSQPSPAQPWLPAPFPLPLPTSPVAGRWQKPGQKLPAPCLSCLPCLEGSGCLTTGAAAAAAAASTYSMGEGGGRGASFQRGSPGRI